MEFGIKNTILFTLASPKMNYLDVRLTKYVKIYTKKTTKLQWKMSEKN